jgi:DNA polymerase-3 subunit alpha
MTTNLRVLLLDTETNGLPKNRFAPIAEPGNWPAVLQLSWAIYTVAGTTVQRIDSRDIGLALDPAIPWDTGAAKIHGLSEAEARRGTAPVKAFAELKEALQSVQIVVAHNLLFDKPVIRAAAYAVGVRDVWPTSGIQELCTMKETQPILRLVSPYYGAGSGKYKAPKLNELYEWLYGHRYDISGATLHSARSDTLCLEQCVKGLLRRGVFVVDGERIKCVDVSA